jgi:hypothetical protein
MFEKENVADGPEEPLPPEVQARLEGTIHDPRQFDFMGQLCVNCHQRLEPVMGLYRFTMAACPPCLEYPEPPDPHAEGYL